MIQTFKGDMPGFANTSLYRSEVRHNIYTFTGYL